MSRTVDERIVKMSLDSKKFEDDAARTVSIFGKMQSAMDRLKGVRLDKTTKDIVDINSAADKTNFSKLTDGVQTVTAKFSALSVVAITTLTNITNRAIDAGIQMAKSFTTKPLTDGFAEYELKMGSIQTILANTSRHGTELNDVTKALDELNTYADKTIYNFGDMTKNIGLFTNAGIKVEDATSMIKGFSNEAAASGTTSEGAAGAAYQLSQALSAGTIRLMDWRSLTNVGMGNKNMQNGLIEIADAMGTLNATSTSAESIQKDFNSSLESNWLSADVMSTYLQIMAGDLDATAMSSLGLTEAQIKGFQAQAKTAEEAATKVRTLTQLLSTAGEALGSGWSETWELLLGNFDEATVMFTNANNVISEIIENSSKSRNALINDFVELGGRKSAIDAISNAFKGMVGVVNAAGDGIRKVFPPATGESLFNLVQGVESFTKKLILNKEQLAKVTTIFEGFASIVDIGVTVVKMITNALKAMIPSGLGGSLLDLVANIASWVTELSKSFKSTDIANSKFETLATTSENLANGIKKAFTFVGDVIDSTGKSISKVVDFIKPAFDAIIEGGKELISSFSAEDLMTGGVIGMLFLTIKKVKDLAGDAGGMFEKIGGFFEGLGGVSGIIEGLTDSLSAMTGAVKAATVLQIGIAVGILALSLKLMSTIPMADLSKSLAALAGVMFLMTKTLGAMGKQSGGIKSALYAATVLPALAIAVVGLAIGLKIFASMNPDELVKGIVSLAAVMGILVGAVVLISKFGGKIKTSAVSVLALATAVLILTQSVKQLSKIDTNDLIKGVGAVGILLLELALFLKIVNKTKFSPASALGVVILAGAILIMVEAIRQISDIPVDAIQKGLITIGLILAEIALFVKLTSGSKVMTAAVGMVVIAQAIKMLIPSITELGNTDTEVLAKGLTAMAIALAEVVLAMKLASGGLLGAVAIMVVAEAISALVPPLRDLGNMSVEQLAKGLIALAIAFGLIAVAANLIGIGGAIGLLAFAAALMAVSVAAVLIGVALNIFIAALNTLAVMTDSTVKNIGKALGSLVDELTKLIPKLVKMAVLAVVSMANGMAAAVPHIAWAGLTLIIGLLGAIRDKLPELLEVGVDLVVKIMEGIGEHTPTLIDAGLQMITDLIVGLANGIRDNGPQLLAAVFNLVEAVLELLITAMVLIVDTLFGWIPGVSGAAKGLGDGAIDALRTAFDSTIASEIGDTAAEGFVDGVDGKKGKANKTGKELAEEARKGASLVKLDKEGTNAGTQYDLGLYGKKAKVKVTGTEVAKAGNQGAGSVKFTGTGANSGTQLDTGLKSTKGRINSTGRSMADGAKKGAASVSLNATGQAFGTGYSRGIDSKKSSSRSSGTGLASTARSGAGSISANNTGSYFGEGFASGIDSKQGRVSGAASRLAGLAKGTLENILKIFSPSRVARDDGGFFGEGFALGIEDEEGNVVNATESLANRAVTALRGMVGTMNDVIHGEMDWNPTLTPVLDMGNMNELKNIEMPNLETVSKFNLAGLANIANIPFGQNQGNSTNVEYNIDVSVAPDDMSYSKAKQFAQLISTEIKNTNDGYRSAVGEEVYY